ncbi:MULTISPECIES: RNA polymerase sigma factor SigJ [Streptomyces]|uniref:RNA polymerase sigma-70 factor (ECF subfamily) n=1 Tax=Streptomyces clavifer TaxID=68188 RepID=A0ABS4V8K3_9ACTN|nr:MULTISPECIES: RNA polymerase sigma factor SigJ [Streptomyces]KQX77942.1 RNA polymerase subunit sigma-70 [Streptomyces sp. Root1319]KQZ10165.1 RNA polymerase subunit sigma-70 [Streptomyces sp. Root55]MBP2360226.1 RNA polymerase sigma-70 factor (ECF subfamily) [Streptomyces clavifer]MDX2743383.1 RNA polymerase sigma factor SigJ [Streptomyces sp. NRRL_B-2557]RPK78759.1 ECF RNA polymerase sigma factor SigJ [Streptomyces sp. ADI97-07]
MAPTTNHTDRFAASMPRLEAIAYRLLGSASDAEDAVQDTFLRWQAADIDRIEVPEAWLTKVLTNLCLNQLTSARARRETYVGQWLPEPLLAGDPMLGPADTVEQRESVSYAVLALMERLSPNERVVYVLREAFDYPHRKIAETLDITEAASQQLYHRAKKHVVDGRARTEIDAAAARRIVDEFLAAATSGRTEPLVRLLTADAIAIGDGGGKVPARTKAFEGALAVATFMRGLFKPGKAKRALVGGSPAVYSTTANNTPALAVVLDGRVIGVMCLEITADGIAAFRSQANPDKLERATRRWAATEHGEPLLHVF